ncbi:MAG TPA: alkaline phosphatase D family protein [Blastocatellia bacterium]|nr:alkaline phosphatase D family protein [Blastocatellia bacterium]
MSESTRINAGPWSGAVSDTRATIKASVMQGVMNARVVVAKNSDLSLERSSFPASFIWSDPKPKKDYKPKIVTFRLEDLTPDTQYYYALELDGKLETGDRVGRFKTFPRTGEKADFRFAFGSCSGNDGFWNFGFPDTEAYLTIAQEKDLLFFFHLGDFHYGNIDDKEIGKRLDRYDWMLQRPEPGALFRLLPLAYCWDDHDFLGNDKAGGDEKHRVAATFARDAYDIYIPHYDFASGADGIYQSFVVGRALFILTDTRFKRSSQNGSSAFVKTVLGGEQKKWLKAKLLEGKSFDLTVWANSIPWIGNPDDDEDYWAGYADERKELANFIKENEIRNLCMISGDAHMLGIDDGSHSGYSDGGKGGFPVFHAAALESRPGEKGGPVYCLGTDDGEPGPGIAGKRQYGLFEVKYERGSNGKPTGSPQVHWTGRRAKKNSSNIKDVKDIIQYRFPAERTYSGF